MANKNQVEQFWKKRAEILEKDFNKFANEVKAFVSRQIQKKKQYKETIKCIICDYEDKVVEIKNQIDNKWKQKLENAQFGWNAQKIELEFLLQEQKHKYETQLKQQIRTISHLKNELKKLYTLKQPRTDLLSTFKEREKKKLKIIATLLMMILVIVMIILFIFTI